MKEQQATIRNTGGFHVRPAQLFSEKAGTFASEIRLVPEGANAEADAKSILNLMTLGLEQGAVVTIRAEGPDEAEAVQQLAELIESGFGEE